MIRNGRVSRLAVILFLAGVTGLAQPTKGVIFGAGYEHPEPLSLMPGQVTTVYVAGIGSAVTQRVKATTVPWPTELAGISAELAPLGWKAPIGQVEPLSTCPTINFRPCGRMVAVTLQVPYKLIGLLVPSAFTVTLLLRDGDGNTTGEAEVRAVGAMPHVLTGCQVALVSNRDGRTGGGSCNAMVFHSDGVPVTPVNPALEGETLVVYLYGLHPGPDPETGFDAPGDLRSDYFMEYAFGDSVEMSWGRIRSRLSPDYLGIVPGEVGLFQANFRVPQIPEGPPVCQPEFLGTLTNLSISIGAAGQRRIWPPSARVPPPFDWFSICVDPASHRPD